MPKSLEQFLNQSMNKLADFIGRPPVFAGVFLGAAAWFIAGLFLEYETWFDIMDVFIFMTTFFMLFVVQSSQNADTKAMQDKLDELLEATPGTNKHKENEEKRLKDEDK